MWASTAKNYLHWQVSGNIHQFYICLFADM